MPEISSNSAARGDPPKHHHLDRRAGDLAATGARSGAGDDLLSTAEVARWLGLSTQFLEIGRYRGYGPAFIRLTRTRVRYRRDAVLRWLREREFQSTADYGDDAPQPRQRRGGPAGTRRDLERKLRAAREMCRRLRREEEAADGG